MPRTILFHLDENCNRAIAEGLRRRGVEVSTTPDANLLSATDEQQLAFCQSQGRVLFTQDHDFLRLQLQAVLIRVSSIAARTLAASGRSSRDWS